MLPFIILVIQSTVHPHACGEHNFPNFFKVLNNGSSPRLWGTFSSVTVDARFERFIPTPVGNIQKYRHISVYSPVHPHACGEHGKHRPKDNLSFGSSPRLWGTYAGHVNIDDAARFIPTPVGNICSSLGLIILFPVHPHACGEHRCYRHEFRNATGSSPRLWGTFFHIQVSDFHNRFIPTPVGNINSIMPDRNSPAVHPHACGEHSLWPCCGEEIDGSSPRLWGTCALRVISSTSSRFIPTPVGNINAMQKPIIQLTVHPHACGEHTSWIMLKSGRFFCHQIFTKIFQCYPIQNANCQRSLSLITSSRAGGIKDTRRSPS